MYTGEDEYKMEILLIDELNRVAALLRDVPMGFKGTVLQEPLMKNQTINCLTSEENTRQP